MKAVQFTAHGGVEVLQLVDLRTPQPQRGEVLIKVTAAGVNYADIMRREGTPPWLITLPFVPGNEVVGQVEALGEDVTDVQVGQQVMAMMDSGGYAEYAVARAAQVIPLPAGLGEAEATALLQQGATAVGLLNTGTYDSVLVLAATGGVGSLLVQIARNRGQQVIAAVGSDAKKAVALALGANTAVSYADADWVHQVRTATSGQGVAASFDAVGGPVGVAALQTLGRAGAGIIYGAASGQPTLLAAQSLIAHNQIIRGYNLTVELANIREYVQELLGYWQNGRLRLPVQTYPVAEVQTAQRDLAARRTQGKVALLF